MPANTQLESHVNRRLILAAPLVALVLAACGSSTSTTSSTANAPATNAAAIAPAPTASSAYLVSPGTFSQIASTVPANGDVNPYGLALVPTSAGKLVAGNLLVSNFNDKANDQGTGTTIVQVSPAGKQSLFATSTRATCRASAPEASV